MGTRQDTIASGKRVHDFIHRCIVALLHHLLHETQERGFLLVQEDGTMDEGPEGMSDQADPL